MLESFRRTHDFRAPSCLCAFLDEKEYTESLIGMAAGASGTSNGLAADTSLSGEYVAVCARQRCGYTREIAFIQTDNTVVRILIHFIVCLERFYSLRGLRLQVCRKRSK